MFGGKKTNSATTQLPQHADESVHVFDQTNGTLKADHESTDDQSTQPNAVNHNVTLGSGTGNGVGWAQYTHVEETDEN